MTDPGNHPLSRIATFWDAAPVELIPRRAIRQDAEFQPRRPKLIPGAIDRIRQEQRLRDSVEQMISFLKAAPSTALEPLWLVEIEGRLILVDGHHRLKAYTAERRTQVPAKVYRGADARGTAFLSARLANTKGSRVQLHRDEHSEAVWACIGQLTDRGKKGPEELLREGLSARAISASFGGRPSHTTVSKMIRLAARVRTQILAEGKPWPSWKQAMRQLCGSQREEPAHQTVEERVERLAEKIARVAERAPTDIRAAAFERAERILWNLDERTADELGVPKGIARFNPDEIMREEECEEEMDF